MTVWGSLAWLRALVAGTALMVAGAAPSAAALPADVFVGSYLGDGLSRLDGTTGATVYANEMGAIDVVLGPDGAIYVTTLFASTVERIDPATGDSLGTFASGGGLDTAVGLTFGPDGHLYVASRSSNQVLRYDGGSGAFIDVFASDAELMAPEDIVFGPDGRLYVTEFGGNRVLRFDGTTGTILGIFATHPSLAGARSMAFDAGGDLYVTGNASNNVVRFDGLTGAFLGVFAIDIPGANGLAFAENGDLFVAAETAGVIHRLDGATGVPVDPPFAAVVNPIGIALPEPVLGLLELAAAGSLAGLAAGRQRRCSRRKRWLR